MPRRRRRVRWGIVASVALTLAVVAFAGWLWAVRWRPAPATFALQGVDVGEAQGEIDWFAVRAAGAEFVYIRATDGVTRDPNFESNWAGAYQAGLRRGATHVYSLCRLAADQAKAFVALVPRTAEDRELPVAVEFRFRKDCPARPDRDVVIGEIRRFLAAVETHTGKPTLLKITRSFDTQYQVSSAIPRNLWAIQPLFPPDYFPRPWRMWQATSFRRVEGIERPTNWDVVAP